MTAEEGLAVQLGDYYVEVIPMEGDYSNSVVKENAIIYNNVYENINIQYTAITNSIKEDIILLKKSEQTSFRYEIKAPGMVVELVNNQLCLYPEGKTLEDVVYILDAPYMIDAADEVSQAIRLVLSRQNEKNILTVTADKEWLHDKERQYPVRIDPTVTPVDVAKENFVMIGVEQGSPTLYIGDNQFPYVGYDDGKATKNEELYDIKHQNCRTYVKVNYDFNSVIPKESKIDSAVFSVSHYTNYSYGQSEFGLYQVNETWSNISWYEKPTNLTFIDVQNSSGVPNAYINYDVKDLVNAWVQEIVTNNGLVLKAMEEPADGVGAMQCEVFNNRHKEFGPRIVVNWSSPVDPFLRDMPLDNTTVIVSPLTEKTTSGVQQVDGIFAYGFAQSGATVEYYVTSGNKKEGILLTEALGKYAYPDSTGFHAAFPNATKYQSKDYNWQTQLLGSFKADTIYQIRAKSYKVIDGEWKVGTEVVSDSFLIYQVKALDTLPKIAQYYGVSLKTIMKDNQVQDTLVMEGNTLFIRNPKTATPYNPSELSDQDKRIIDAELMGRSLHCEFDFEPINLNTGNFYMDQTDVSMNEFGGAFTISRSYNSLSADRNSMFGRGWSFSFDQGIYLAKEGRLVYSRGDGSRLYFTPNADGTYSAPAGYVYTLKKATYTAKAEDGTVVTEIGWQISDASQNIMMIDKYGILISITNANGFVTKLAYDAEYNLSSITTASGKVYKITQNGRGFISSITLPDESVITYDYNGDNNLVAVTNGNGDTRTYQYDTSHQMTSWADESGNIVIKNVYDTTDRVTKQTDANGNVATISYGTNTTTTIDNEGNKTVYTYDDNKRTIAITYPDGSWVTKSYNAKNQLAEETTAKGTKKYTYDKFGNISIENREDGAVVTYQYNAQNRVVSVTGYAGGTVTYEYDNAGNLVKTTQADGSVVTCTYDAYHRHVSQTDGRGVKTTYTYDGPNMTGMTDGEGQTWQFTYDAMNRQIGTKDPLGNTTSI